jgi:hypothetical protein
MIPPSLGAFFSQSQSGTSQSQSGTFDTPPPAQPTAEENHPTAFLEPTRDNAIFSQSQSGTFDTPPPEENHPTTFLEPTRDNAVLVAQRRFRRILYRAIVSDDANKFRTLLHDARVHVSEIPSNKKPFPLPLCICKPPHLLLKAKGHLLM